MNAFKQKPLSKQWVLSAFPLTAPVSWRDKIVCNDDCENCPLYTGQGKDRGCARDCNRWDNLVCQNCPCLGSKYAALYGQPETVDPKTNKDVPISPCLLKIRNQRLDLDDGELVDARILN